MPGKTHRPARVFRILAPISPDFPPAARRDAAQPLRRTRGGTHRPALAYRVKRAEELLPSATTADNSPELRLALEIARTVLG
ncbi:hypothetical protein OHS81_00755 [Streptomyces sp. NBC_00400]|uniref:hypothetical protein n=1 Tax=Streptomyces sp. NBC_00400 TaxID=2975737 RepID=UPI002E2300DD